MLRHVALVAAEHGGDAGTAFAAAVGAYEAGAGALTLDAALGLSPGRGGEPWWVAEARQDRAELLRELSRRFFGALPSANARAEAIAAGLHRYAATGWLTERAFRDPPPARRGTAAEMFFRILKRGEPPAERTIRAVLTDVVGNEIPPFARQPERAENRE